MERARVGQLARGVLRGHIMNTTGDERVSAMLNHPHLGELICPHGTPR
jgi:hypothetical protein